MDKLSSKIKTIVMSDATSRPVSTERPRFSSDTLLSGAREVIIEHAGDEYRLRLTSQGKLILTK